MPPASVATKTVLIADDTAFVRERFQTALQDAGHRAVTVKSAAELLARVRADQEEIDLLVIDLRLPHSSGVELVRAVRQDRRAGGCPILVFSGTISSAEEVRELASLGVAGYVNEYSAVQHILPSLAPHLFPDSFNRRSSPRVVLEHPGRLPLRRHHHRGAHAQPRQGRHRHPHDEPARGSAAKARIRFRLPGARREVEADARVAWSDRRIGMGLQFERLDAADQAAVDEFVDGHFFNAKP